MPKATQSGRGRTTVCIRSTCLQSLKSSALCCCLLLHDIRDVWVLYGIEKRPAGDLRVTASFRFRYNKSEGTSSLFAQRTRSAWCWGARARRLERCLVSRKPDMPAGDPTVGTSVDTARGAKMGSSCILASSEVQPWASYPSFLEKSILPSSYFNKVFFKRWRNRCFFFSTGIFRLRRNPLSESGSQALSVKCPIRNKIPPMPPVCTNLFFFLKNFFSFLIEV